MPARRDADVQGQRQHNPSAQEALTKGRGQVQVSALSCGLAARLKNGCRSRTSGNASDPCWCPSLTWFCWFSLLIPAHTAVKAPMHTQHTGQHGDDGLVELIPWSWPGGSHGATSPLPGWSWGREPSSGLKCTSHWSRGNTLGDQLPP